MRRAGIHIRISLFFAIAFALAGCGSASSGGCEGPALDFTSLQLLKKGAKLTGTANPGKAFIVLPNPIEATKNGLATADSQAVQNAISGFLISNLLSPTRLESEFVKIRQSTLTDDASLLAQSDSNGNFEFKVSDPHYWETMAYFSINSEMGYLEALGFKFVRSRPLFVMVKAKSTKGNNSPNAYYDHAYFSPNQPRTIRLFGEGEFAPGIDADMYRHETGHFFNESVSAEVGFDFAGDAGAYFTQGAAIHEAFADYAAMTIGEKPNVGKWVTRSIEGFSPGQPLRSAVDTGRYLIYQDIAYADPLGNSPERYKMAEWLTRILWALRDGFIKERGVRGAINADLLMYSSLSLLKRDSSLVDLRAAMIVADAKLYCGGHAEAIQNEFEKRGLTAAPPAVTEKISITTQPVGIGSDGKPITTIQPGNQVAFAIQLRNTDRVTARNVRVKLESVDSKLIPAAYMQGYGDLAAGQSLNVGNGGWPLDAAVTANVDSRAARGTQVKFRLRVLVENGPDQITEGGIQL